MKKDKIPVYYKKGTKWVKTFLKQDKKRKHESWGQSKKLPENKSEWSKEAWN